VDAGGRGNLDFSCRISLTLARQARGSAGAAHQRRAAVAA